MIAWDGLIGRSPYAIYRIDIDPVATTLAKESRYRVFVNDKVFITGKPSEDAARAYCTWHDANKDDPEHPAYYEGRRNA